VKYILEFFKFIACFLVTEIIAIKVSWNKVFVFYGSNRPYKQYFVKTKVQNK